MRYTDIPVLLKFARSVRMQKHAADEMNPLKASLYRLTDNQLGNAFRKAPWLKYAPQYAPYGSLVSLSDMLHREDASQNAPRSPLEFSKVYPDSYRPLWHVKNTSTGQEYEINPNSYGEQRVYGADEPYIEDPHWNLFTVKYKPNVTPYYHKALTEAERARRSAAVPERDGAFALFQANEDVNAAQRSVEDTGLQYSNYLKWRERTGRGLPANVTKTDTGYAVQQPVAQSGPPANTTTAPAQPAPPVNQPSTQTIQQPAAQLSTNQQADTPPAVASIQQPAQIQVQQPQQTGTQPPPNQQQQQPTQNPQPGATAVQPQSIQNRQPAPPKAPSYSDIANYSHAVFSK